MFNEIEELNNEIEKFKTNIIGSEKLIDALFEVSTSYKSQIEKSQTILNEFKESHDNLLKRQDELNLNYSSALENTMIKIDKNHDELTEEINKAIDNIKFNKTEIVSLDSKMSLFQNKVILWLKILTGFGISLIILLVVALIRLYVF